MHPTHASRRHARIVDGTLHLPAPAPQPTTATRLQPSLPSAQARKTKCSLRRLLCDATATAQPARLVISSPSSPLRFDHTTRTFHTMARCDSVPMAGVLIASNAAPAAHAAPTKPLPPCPGLSSHPVRRRASHRDPAPTLPEVLALVASNAGPASHAPPAKPLPPCPGLTSHPVRGRAPPRAPGHMPPTLPKVPALITSNPASPPAVIVSPPTPRPRSRSPPPHHRLRPADAWEVEARRLRRELAGHAEAQRELQDAVARLQARVGGLERENAERKDRAAVAQARAEALAGSVRALARQFAEAMGVVGKCRAEMGALERTVGMMVAGGRAALRRPGTPGTAPVAAGPSEHDAPATPVGGALAAPRADGMSLAESQTPFKLSPPATSPSPSDHDVHGQDSDVELSPPATPPSSSGHDVHDQDSDVEFKRLSQLSNATSAPISTQSLPSCDISTLTIRPLNLVSRVRFRQLAEDDASEVLPEMDTWAWSSTPVLGLRDPRE